MFKNILSEHECFLLILHQNGGTMNLLPLAQEMLSRNALGFGVETIDVGFALRWEGRVILKHSDESHCSGDPDIVVITESGIKLLKDLKLI